MKEITKIQKYWHYQKYNVMMRDYRDYLHIKTIIKHGATYEELIQALDTILQKPIGHKAFINTFQHLWGYFKKEATIEEKEHYLQIMDLLESQSTHYTSYIHFIQQLIQKYNNQYLYQSAIMDIS